MSKMNFIKTQDKQTFEELIKLGYTFLGEQSGIYTFANNGNTNNINFNEKKITYTNMYNC